MFWDANIPYESKNIENIKEIVGTAIKLGFDCIALNHVVTNKLGPNDTAIPKPIDLALALETNTRDDDEDNASNFVPLKPKSVATLRLQANQREFNQLSRITVHVEDPSQLFAITSANPVLQSYDIVAIRPLKDKIFQACCQTLEIDLISLDITKRFPFAVKTAMVQQAIARGIHFEISIGAALKDANIRRHMLSNALHLVRVTKGRNIIITSEAQRAMDLRSPYDLINLGVLFGLNQADAKLCVSKHCNSMLLHGATRKTAKGVVGMQKISDLGPNEMWKLPNLLSKMNKMANTSNTTNTNNTNTKTTDQQNVSADVEMKDNEPEEQKTNTNTVNVQTPKNNNTANTGKQNNKKRKHSK